jgi:hypothetical protein
VWCSNAHMGHFKCVRPAPNQGRTWHSLAVGLGSIDITPSYHSTFLAKEAVNHTKNIAANYNFLRSILHPRFELLSGIPRSREADLEGAGKGTMLSQET